MFPVLTVSFPARPAMFEGRRDAGTRGTKGSLQRCDVILTDKKYVQTCCVAIDSGQAAKAKPNLKLWPTGRSGETIGLSFPCTGMCHRFKTSFGGTVIRGMVKCLVSASLVH